MTAPSAAARWAEALEAWAIPEPILAAAPESPWGFPTVLFAHAAEQATAGHGRGPSRERALEALADGGSVLDVGVGAGAASLPLAPPATLLVGVDQSPAMLEAFARAAEGRGVGHREVEGLWPAVAPAVEPADVVVCHHVLYNVADVAPFLLALTDRARRRVVVELTAVHPQLPLNPLWRALHGLERPTAPTWEDAVAVVDELGLDARYEASERSALWTGLDRADVVGFARRRLCVGPVRDAEIDALLPAGDASPLRHLVTVWWDGGA